MKGLKNFITISCLLMLIIGFQSVDAQQNIAQEAYAILEDSCDVCHGEEGGSYTELFILKYPDMIEDGDVIRGDPENSELYKRLIETDPIKRMPAGLPRLSDDKIETIYQWILAGAPDWNVGRPLDRSFITTDVMLDSIQKHLDTLAPFDRPYARYFTLTHLYNAGELADTLVDYRHALSKLVNSLSWGSDVVNPEPIDTEETIFYINLPDYEWDVGTDRWAQIEEAYPYSFELTVETETGLLRKLTNLREAMECNVPFVHVDWFLAAASLPPLYNDILGLPETDRALEVELDVDVATNLQTYPGIRVWRAGFNDSGVSRHNRVVERHTSRYGAYWKSYDFAGSVGTQNIFDYPINFTQDGGEIIFNLPNGLQAYYLVDANGNRLDVAPTDIVSNPAASDPAVYNGLSCIGCHTEGMKTFEDTVRGVIEANANLPGREHALRLYVEKSEMDALVNKDAERYRIALEAAGGDVKDIEPVHRFYEAFNSPLDAVHAAAAVGFETADFLDRINNDSRLQDLGLVQLTVENGQMQRDAWTAGFPEVVSTIYDDVLLPEPDDRDDPISGVVIMPDLNLRDAIRRTLNMSPDATITPIDMKRLRIIVADEQGISDLSGLQFAENLERIEFRRNAISDLSPLAGLTKLNNIKLRGNQITDITPLENLTRVDWLGLEQNQITDLSPLKKLTKLQGVGISGNPVTDVSPLVDLTSLERIDAWRTPVSDFTPLASLPRLEWIEYGNDRNITEMPSLQGLKSLRRLEIHGCTISDLTPLSEFTQLEWLELVNNAISDLTPLSNLKNLTILNLDANLITDVKPLAGLTRLNVLYLENNVISDVSALSNLSNLERLDLRNNAISDFTSLDGLSDKTFVRMVGNPGFPTGGPKIRGPWLWAIVPGTRLDTRTDFLARATGGAATEVKVSANGPTAGKAVGESTWTWHSLGSGGNNINEMTESLGWGTGEEIYDHIVYGAVTIDSPREQQLSMFVGSSDSVKVWLNGELVHQAFVNRGANDFEDFFPVTLEQGQNVLLVALDNHGHGSFSGHFGFALDAEYDLFREGTRFLFDTDATSFEVGDMFTLHLNTENVRNLAGWQADLVFNADVLEAVEMSEGDFLMSEDEDTHFSGGTIDNETGKITGIRALRIEGGVSGKGTLCSVSFNVIGPGECLLTLENFEAGSSFGDPLPSIPPEYLITVEGEPIRPAWDVNKDGQVNVLDLIQVAQSLNADVSTNPEADVNGDGIINILDLIVVARNFAAAAPSLVAMDSEKLTPAMVQSWIKQAQLVDDGSIAFRRGIANLQRLLETIAVPEKTALLMNYPNPFNPETWIPYHLAKPADVTLTIYAANGTVVRSLVLGHQAAGIYQSRGRAVYWDGKNEIGESVASGIYFYMFTAGDFTATRKMLLMK
ncbi:MAG: leucine-rich repeat domain-containing protein [Candidatus Poribacteria bacterium]|nr:leucine-rich repeat domain-containing protein [Candidatus Poribacteria bacterium]